MTCDNDYRVEWFNILLKIADEEPRSICDIFFAGKLLPDAKFLGEDLNPIQTRILKRYIAALSWMRRPIVLSEADMNDAKARPKQLISARNISKRLAKARASTEQDNYTASSTPVQERTETETENDAEQELEPESEPESGRGSEDMQAGTIIDPKNGSLLRVASQSTDTDSGNDEDFLALPCRAYWDEEGEHSVANSTSVLTDNDIADNAVMDDVGRSLEIGSLSCALPSDNDAIVRVEGDDWVEVVKE